MEKKYLIAFLIIVICLIILIVILRAFLNRNTDKPSRSNTIDNIKFEDSFIPSEQSSF